MKIIRTSQNQTSPIYGQECQSVIDQLFDGKQPFGSLHCLVKPGVISTIHNHHEYECFFITKGSGLLTIGEEQEDIQEGDIIHIPPFSDHTIRNNTDQNLQYLTFWWEDIVSLEKLRQLNEEASTTLVFSTPPTPNGDLHLGHLSGPYTGADIYRRYLELVGASSYHVTGRDDNQSYVPRKALDQERVPEELADDYSDRMERTLARNAIRIDHYGHPKKSPYHVDLTRKVVTELYEKGFIVEREVESLFCRATGKYLYEAHVRGLCPHCNVESDGNACEQCGRPNDVTNLVNPRSKYASEGVEIKKVRKLYFKMSAFSEQLREYHREAIMPAHLASLCHRMIEDGLPDICVSHPTDWGIEVPVAGYEDQRIYVWFEMAAGYLAAAQETAEKSSLTNKEDAGWRHFFSNKSAEVVHFFGFDNGYFHALLFPAIYMALDWGIRPPAAFVVNELLNLDGLKFSTSRGHLIWGSDLLDIVPSDYVRYYLSYVRPETEKTNFTLGEFSSVINGELAGRWQIWLDTLFARNERLFESKVPAPGAWTKEHRAFFEFLEYTLKQAKNSYHPSDFSPQRICRLANEIVRETSRFSSSQRHYEGCKLAYNELRTGFALELAAAKTLALIIQPIMPGFACSLWEILEGNQNMKWTETPSFVKEGQLVAPPGKAFFSTVPDAVHALRK